MYKDILNSTAHRSYPLPEGPWLMTQRWDHVFFIHLPVSKDIITRFIPNGLELDCYEETAWISILPFQISNMHFRKLPPIPFVHSFLELNVRTYVTRNGIPGIYFFSLDASNLPAVLGARIVTLPYFYAKMKMKKQSGTFYFNSIRKGSSNAVFEGSYRPISEAYYPEKPSLSNWLLERYSLWSYRNHSLYRGDIHHKRWKIQDVEATVEKENMLLDFPRNMIVGNPIFHYAYSRRVLFWPLKKVK